MTEHQALILPAKFGQWEVGTVPTPKPGPDELLIKVLASALNPIDWKIQKYGLYVQTFPGLVGMGGAGEVTEVGENVKNFKKGDKVLHPGWTTHQQYVVAPADISAKIPPSITVDEAATIPLAVATAAVGLYQKDQAPIPVLVPDGKCGLGLTPPWTAEGKGKYSGNAIVVFGGSSSVGQYVIQLAKLSGFSPIITTCSAKHDEYVQSLGATHTVDHRGDTVADIQKLLPGGKTDYVYDSISTAETQKQAVKVLSGDGRLLLTLPPVEGLEIGKKDVRKTFASVEHLRQLGVELYDALPRLLESGDIKPNKLEVLPNGLAGIIDGLERMATGKVSGVKLVAHPWE